MTRDEAINLLRGGMAKGLQQAAAQYALPVCWIAAQNRRPILLGSGTGYMLNCGAGPFLVTAAHVLEGFRDARATYPDAVCLVGAIRFPLAERLIAEDRVRDIATFELRAHEIEALRLDGKCVLTGSQNDWPPAPPALGRGVFFVGFPGDGRTMRPYRGNSVVEVDWTGYTALTVASGLSETDLTLVLEHDQNVDIGLRPVAPPDWALGGCSGAPVLTLVDHNQVLSWRLAGTISQASATIIKVARADCINPDGSLTPHPNPMTYLREQRMRRQP